MGRICNALLVCIASAGIAGAAEQGSQVPFPIQKTEAMAWASGANDGTEDRIEARLLIGPGTADGRTAVGVLFDLDPGWHLYWRNPGETGLPTRIDWSGTGLTLDAERWPAPKRFAESDGSYTTYGYEQRVLVMADLVRDAREPETRELRADVDLLVCETSCVPANFSLSRSWEQTTSAETALFREFSARVPERDPKLRVDAIYSQSAIRPGDPFEAAIALSETSHAVFYPYLLKGISFAAGKSTPRPDGQPGRLVTMSGEAESGSLDPASRLAGVVELADAAGELRFVEVELPLPVALADAVVTQPAEWTALVSASAGFAGLSIWKALLLAFVGGLILNLMPCVLPVLFIKVVSVTELSGRARGDAIAQGAGYAAGILTAMFTLALVVSGLRSAGHAVGWGFQFQEPIFLLAICTVLVIFANNLFGVFEINLDTGRLGDLGSNTSGAARSFFDGLLAAILATPCSAPFLGTAVGFALAGAVPLVFAIFASVGLGLASPFLLITLVPGLAAVLPRPGAWMVKLRTMLGFALLGTVIWLLWVLGRAAGLETLISAMALLTVIAFVCWLFGLAQASDAGGMKWGTAGAVLVLSVTGMGTVGARPAAPIPSATELARTFDRAAIDAELASGKTVFAYFTADWCITCAANERLVLSNARVRKAFERLDVVTFKADWTRRDEMIRAELARYGRAGVPMYLVFNPQSPTDPAVLPELLSVDLVIKQLERAANRL